MPTYSYKCTSCGVLTDHSHSITGREEFKPSCACGGVGQYTFVPSVPLVSFIDGPSGSWPSKGNRFKKYREKAAADAQRRQDERFASLKGGAVPNYKGVETGTWRDAQVEALKDAGPEKASTFNAKVAEEKKDKLS